MTPDLTYQPQTNSGTSTLIIDKMHAWFISLHIRKYGWNNEPLREAQMKRTKKTCRTIKYDKNDR